MISVGVRALKNQLSQYLQFVKAGERIYITEHNKIIAELSLPRVGHKQLGIEKILEQLALSGKLQKAMRNEPLATVDQKVARVEWISVYKQNKSDN